MSGIAGIVRLDARPVETQCVEVLQQAMARRGPDAAGSWVDRSTALVHTMFHTTAEACAEPQPLIHSNIAIVADIRLDYREQLLTLLDMQQGKSVGDAQLVIAAYRRWGTRCPGYLDGDFAFALWDIQQHRLFCARDPFGVKPFVYCLVAEKLFAFASQIRGLLAQRGISHQFNEQRIADFLAVHFKDTQSTFYRDIRRLPGGCCLSLQDGKLAVSRYWSPGRVPSLPPASNAEYTQGYRERFDAAVRTRLRVTRISELGSMLSGGLDSSAITCAARDAIASAAGPLPVFSWIFSDARCADEREYQDIVVNTGRLQRHTLDSATTGYSPWTQLERFLPDGPLYAPNFYLNYGAAELAHGLGIRTILDGAGGDSTISRGATRLVELLLRGRPHALVRELRAMAIHRHLHASTLRMFLANVIAPLAPAAVLRFTERLRGKPVSDSASKLLSPQFVKRTQAPASPYRPALTARQQHLAELTSPMLAEGLELFDRVLSECHVEGRYPFFDRRLAEYCLALPADQKLADGYSRIVARRAMEGSVPSAVQWRHDKGKPGLHILPALRAHRSRLDDLFVRDPSVIEPYVSIDALRELYQDFLAERPLAFVSVIRLWSIAVLGYWLRHAQETLTDK